MVINNSQHNSTKQPNFFTPDLGGVGGGSGLVLGCDEVGMSSTDEENETLLVATGMTSSCTSLPNTSNVFCRTNSKHFKTAATDSRTGELDKLSAR